MTRAFLKKLLACSPMPQISAEMYVDPFVRSLARVSERARIRYRKEMLELIADPTLTDAQRVKGFHKAKRHEDAAREKERAMRERYDREVRIPELIAAGVLRKLPAKSGKRRA
jgi:hypothetical protein